MQKLSKEKFAKLLTRKNVDTALFGISAATGAGSLGLTMADRKKYKKLHKKKDAKA